MKKSTLRFALPKGRVLDEALPLLQKIGFSIEEDVFETRKLILSMRREDTVYEILLAKPTDVPTYVEYGVADIGIVGSDILLEQKPKVFELLDMEIGYCHLSVAGLPDKKNTPLTIKVATKYPQVATEYFRKKGEQVEIIHLHGSIELAPILGLSDCIVDIVSTGTTLKENGLIEKERICDISTRFIANISSYRLKSEEITNLLEQLRCINGGGPNE